MKARTRVVAAIFEDAGRILLAKRRPDGPFANKWEFPGGKVQSGETDEIALQREIQEELRVSARIGALFMKIAHDYPKLCVEVAFYSCELSGPPVFQMTSHSETRWVPRSELTLYDILEADLPVIQKLMNGVSVTV